MKRFFWLLCLLPVAAFAAPVPAKPLAPTFPFTMSPFDSTPTAVDMSFLNPEPAGAHGFVRVQGDQFVDGAGRPLRLLGTNFTFAGVFPPKESAPKVAARLRKLGMNVVRIHHADNRTAPGGIWNADLKTLDPAQLDRLDWLIFQLKQHGIYTNLNLHVSRNYPGITSLGADAQKSFKYGKVLDNFHQPYIELQREYARELLTHVNPYTGKAYCEEPAIVTVEINNENTLLISNWTALRNMPEPFQSDLTAQWRRWLSARYKSTAELRKAWNAGSEPLGAELLKNGDFSDGTKNWSLRFSNPAEGTLTAVTDGPGGRPAISAKTTQKGTLAWDFQILQGGMTLTEGAPYTLSFEARAMPAQRSTIDLRLDQEPWTGCGFSESIELTPQWKSFTYTFVARNTVPKHVRVTLGLNNQLGEFQFANVSLRRGGIWGLPEGQTLEANNIVLPPSNSTTEQQRDFWTFLAETERAYVRDFVRFLKQDLKVRTPIIDTQASYGGIAGTYREASLCDFTDMHSYWQHPSFPGKPWDGNNWVIGNTSMVREASGGTLFRLAMHRVEGKPFTVSEYDHPAPSFYSAEMLPMVASYGAYQGWNGLYQFDYGDTAGDEARISGYFQMRAHPAKIAFMPIAALLFRGGAVKTGGAPVVLEVPEGKVIDRLLTHGTSTTGVWSGAGAAPDLALGRRVAVRFPKGNGPVRLVGAPKKASETRASETGEIHWQAGTDGQAIYTVNTPTVRCAVGYLGGRTVRLGDVQVTMPETPSNWASVAVAALDGKPVAESGRLLLVAMGRAENTGMGWNEKYTSVARKWGTGPTRVEGIPLQVSVPGAVKSCQALDGAGAEKRPVPTRAEGKASQVNVGPEYETVWYVLTR